jgi:hypothetical protein
MPEPLVAPALGDELLDPDMPEPPDDCAYASPAVLNKATKNAEETLRMFTPIFTRKTNRPHRKDYARIFLAIAGSSESCSALNPPKNFPRVVFRCLD